MKHACIVGLSTSHKQHRGAFVGSRSIQASWQQEVAFESKCNQNSMHGQESKNH